MKADDTTDVVVPRAYWAALEEKYQESPIHRLFGLRLHIVRQGLAEITSEGTREGLNAYSTAAGGLLATMIDSAVVQACRGSLPSGAHATTLELKVNFVRALPGDRAVTALGVVEHLGRTTAVGVAHVRDGEGRTYALGIVTVAIRRPDAAG